MTAESKPKLIEFPAGYAGHNPKALRILNLLQTAAAMQELVDADKVAELNAGDVAVLGLDPARVHRVVAGILSKAI